ncbi:retrovirus-related pol polyprotein from transposon TNT 1-94 [Tanacetum coccineum]
MRKSYCEEYNRNLTLEAELSKMNELLKSCSRLQNHCISLELKLQQNKESFQNNRSCSNLDAPALNDFFFINVLKAQLQAKESSISKLRAHIATLKGKNVLDTNVPVTNASVIAPGMFRLDLEPLSSKLKNNREAHEDCLQKNNEHTDTLREIVEQARKLNPSDPYLEKSKKHTHKPKSEDFIQEKLYLLHMDLCGLMRIESINGKKYILIIVDDYSRFTWAEAVATACYTQNQSLIRKRHNKTPYELLHDRKPKLKYLHVFGALCYLTNNNEDLRKLKLKADIGSIFQPMFDEYFNPPPSIVSPVLTAAAPRPADPTGTPLSTSVEQNTLAASTSSTTQETQSLIISEGVKGQLQQAPFNDDPFLDILTSEPSS